MARTKGQLASSRSRYTPQQQAISPTSIITQKPPRTSSAQSKSLKEAWKFNQKARSLTSEQIYSLTANISSIWNSRTAPYASSTSLSQSAASPQGKQQPNKQRPNKQANR